jgi:quinol monooxygenase YgiN
MTDNAGKVSAIVKLTAKPGLRDELVAEFNAVRPLVDAEEGTEQYSVHLDQADADVVWIVEVYSDQAAFEGHSSGAVIAQLVGALGTKLADRGMEMHLATALPSKGVAAT